MKTIADKSPIGLAGEYYVLAQLAHRGLVGTMTLSNTKGVDILVLNQEMDNLYKLEVKTTRKPQQNEGLFGENYCWVMAQKHEKIKEKNLYYCFVRLKGEKSLPDFYIVPSLFVANYVRNEHRKWLKSAGYKVSPTTMRRFRISILDPHHFKNAWRVFSK